MGLPLAGHTIHSVRISTGHGNDGAGHRPGIEACHNLLNRTNTIYLIAMATAIENQIGTIFHAFGDNHWNIEVLTNTITNALKKESVHFARSQISYIQLGNYRYTLQSVTGITGLSQGGTGQRRNNQRHG